MKVPLLGIQYNLQDHLQYQVILEEVILAAQIWVLTILELLARQIAALLTIDPLDQAMALLGLPMAEVSQMGTAQEAHRADHPLRILPALALQADLVLEVPQVLQVEVQADPRAAVAQEDPEEGGINSPFFLEILSENNHNFVTNPT